MFPSITDRLLKIYTYKIENMRKEAKNISRFGVHLNYITDSTEQQDTVNHTQL